jgi:hypothetical protein
MRNQLPEIDVLPRTGGGKHLLEGGKFQNTAVEGVDDVFLFAGQVGLQRSQAVGVSRLEADKSGEIDRHERPPSANSMTRRKT